MVSIAEFTLAPAGFPLGRVFETKPGVTLELDRVVPSSDTVMPYFWVQDGERELDAVTAVFANLPELRSIVLLEDLGDKGLYRAEWKPEYMGIMEAIAQTGLTVVAATGSNGGWEFELRATEADQFAAFNQYCTDHDIDVTLTRLRHLSDASDDGGDEPLTAEQRDALLLAYEAGYYDEDRKADLETLAERLSISRQALSARLRRGYRRLVERYVATGRRGDP